MALLYFFDSTAKFPVLDYDTLCSYFYNAFLQTRLSEKGAIKHFWKIPGEPRLIGVVSVEAPGELDAFFKSAVWLQGFSIHVTTVFTPLRAYEDFAATVGDRLGEESNISLVECVPRTGLHYFLTFTVEYEGMTQEDLFRIWREEAKAALDAKKSGTVLDLWKVVAQRKVFAIVCVSKPGELDAISFDLPIMKKMGDKVHITCKSLRQADDWIKEVGRKIYKISSLPDHFK